MIQNVIFDLDGTLLNTLDDIADTGNWVCERNGWPTFTTEEFKQMVGHGIPNLVQSFSPADARTEELLAGTRAQFSARYAAHREDKTAPYAGVKEMLRTLRANGINCTVFSNKADAMCQILIRDYFDEHISAVRGHVADVPLKPDPAGMFALMEAQKMDAATTVFVGDSEVDVETAKNAGVNCIAVLWGFRTKEVLEAAGATTFAETPEALTALLLENK